MAQHKKGQAVTNRKQLLQRHIPDHGVAGGRERRQYGCPPRRRGIGYTGSPAAQEGGLARRARVGSQGAANFQEEAVVAQRETQHSQRRTPAQGRPLGPVRLGSLYEHFADSSRVFVGDRRGRARHTVQQRLRRTFLLNARQADLVLLAFEDVTGNE
jgi:hypothetical protein